VAENDAVVDLAIVGVKVPVSLGKSPRSTKVLIVLVAAVVVYWLW